VIFLIIGFVTAGSGSGSGSSSSDGQSQGSGPAIYPYSSTQAAEPAGSLDSADSPTTQTPGLDTPTGSLTDTPTNALNGTSTATATASGTGTASPSPVATDPAGVVQAAYADVNRHDYQDAFNLGLAQNGETYQTFVAGFSSTQSDTVTVESVDGDVVTVALLAVSTDGSETEYAGTYTVSGGVITAADLQQAG
jgi:hypothetical protein